MTQSYLSLGCIIFTAMTVSWNGMDANTQQKMMGQITRQTAQGIFYYHNQTLVQEVNPELSKLSFLYAHPLGKILRQIMRLKTFSKLVGRYYDSARSVRSIEKFIKDYNIDMSEYEQANYKSFNDFFIRKLKPGTRIIDIRSSALTSPCDGKLFVVPNLSDKAIFYLKQLPFNLERFVKNDQLAQQYVGGTLMIFRLAPYDYHRFHFPLDCTPKQATPINGKLDSVNPFVYKQGIQVLTENERHLIELQTENFGNMLMIPVGALCVGKIVESYLPGQQMKKGDEAGYFMFGGSTVVLVIPPGKINLEKEFIEHSAQGFETAVKLGQAIGFLNNI